MSAIMELIREFVPGADIPYDRRRKKELEGAHALLLALKESQGAGTDPQLQAVRDSQQADAARESQRYATQPGREKIKSPFKSFGRYLADDEGQIDLTNVKTQEDVRARLLQLDNIDPEDRKVLLENIAISEEHRGIKALSGGLSKITGVAPEDIEAADGEQLKMMASLANAYGHVGIEGLDGLYAFSPSSGEFTKKVDIDPNLRKPTGNPMPFFAPDEKGNYQFAGFRMPGELPGDIVESTTIARGNAKRINEYKDNLPFIASTVTGLQKLTDDVNMLGSSGWFGQGASFLSGVRSQIDQVLGQKAADQLYKDVDTAFYALAPSRLKTAAIENSQIRATLFNVTMAIAQAQSPSAKSHAFEKIKLIMSSIMSDNLNDPNAAAAAITRMMQDITSKHRIEGRNIGRNSADDILGLLDPSVVTQVTPLLRMGDAVDTTPVNPNAGAIVIGPDGKIIDDGGTGVR